MGKGVVLMFSGRSDNTFGEYHCKNEDYDNCASLRPIQFIVDCGEKGRLMVIGQYINGCWAVGVGLVDEEDKMPVCDIRIEQDPECSYSMMAIIRISGCKPDEVDLHVLDDGHPVRD